MSLSEEIYARLASTLTSTRTKHLIVASLKSAEQIRRTLGGEPPASEPSVDRPKPSFAGAFLTSLTAKGFRGIGREATLKFSPGPGLTLVVGRNGSGKSSFSEGLEVLLTGDSSRWRDKPRVWAEGWRNLHQGSDTRVIAEISGEGYDGSVAIERTWPPEATGADDGTAVVKLPAGNATSLAEIGWTSALDLYQPILPHTSLASALADRPSVLFDRLTAVLGLEPLLEASSRLRGERLHQEEFKKVAEKRLPKLRDLLQSIDEDRARRTLKAIGSKPWALGDIASVLGDGANEVGPDLQTLQQLSALQAPDPEVVGTVAKRLEGALQVVRRLEATEAAEARQLADMLKAAVDHHRRHGDETCPVCQVGLLDEQWHRTVETKIEDLERKAAAFDAAIRDRDAAVKDARRLLATVPKILLRCDTVGIEGSKAVLEWERWSTQPEDAEALVQHLRDRIDPLYSATTAVSSAASEEYKARQDAWAPAAREVREWLQIAQQADAARPKIVDLRSAESWMKEATAELRERRFRPISSQARDLWEQLRLDSNVDLTRIMLEGKGTQRHVALKVNVDDTSAAAQAVMSQGELNCLALSLFLPRASLDESPFRFIVIDDPVQAMDPARVDGLARVFSSLAKTRQVVVLTHDDRLPEAARRLNLPTTILEVVRRPGSIVEVREALDPVKQYFADARAVARDQALDESIRRRLAPGFCRSGLEAACVEVIRRRRVTRGDRHSDVEAALMQAHRLYVKASLAFFDDDSRTGDVLSFINSKWARRYADAFKQCNEGAHGELLRDLLEFTNDCQSLAERIRTLN